MTNYQIEFITDSLDCEADYLCYVAKELAERRYQSNGFTVLPYVDSKNPFSVHFPDWPYSSEFWRTIGKSTSNNCGESFPKSCTLEVAECLGKSKDDRIAHKTFLEEWRKFEKKVMPLILENLPHCMFDIRVLVTIFGTRGSFYASNNRNKIIIFCTVRIDLPVTELIRTLVTAVYQSITGAGGEIGSTPYHQWMAYADFTVVLTKISGIAKLKPRLLNPKAKVSLKTHRDSQAFLQKLGLSWKSELRLNGEAVELRNTPLNTFTPQEKQLLGELIKSKDKVISFEQAGEVVWRENSDNKFSLYALAKLVENIRTKLREAGVNTSPIKTIRRQGYLFTG